MDKARSLFDHVDHPGSRVWTSRSQGLSHGVAHSSFLRLRKRRLGNRFFSSLLERRFWLAVLTYGVREVVRLGSFRDREASSDNWHYMFYESIRRTPHHQTVHTKFRVDTAGLVLTFLFLIGLLIWAFGSGEAVANFVIRLVSGNGDDCVVYLPAPVQEEPTATRALRWVLR